jgi:UDP-N-acetyl-D-mannosaminuronic acid dehydrogenase
VELPLGLFTVKVAVVGGAGHAGLPLAVFLAGRGHEVVVIDSDKGRLELIEGGKSPFFEPDLEKSLRIVLDSRKFSATSNHSAVAGADVVVVVVGTDLNDQQQPQNDSVFGVVRQLCDHLSSSSSVMLRSTVMPGTTAAVAEMLGKRINEVAFCPERIAEGRALEELGSIPQLVGTANGVGSRKLNDLFSSMGVDTITMSWEEAELSKLILNSWRYSQFAFANEIARVCERHNVSFSRIRPALLDRYPRGQGLMAPGFAGGPCLRKDTLQFLAGAASDSLLFNAVIQSHDHAVTHVVDTVLEQLRTNTGTVVQLGLTFKPGSDDLRGSVAIQLAESLAARVKNFFVVDPYIRAYAGLHILPLDEALRIAQVVVVGTRHPEFVGLSVDAPVVDPAGLRLVNPDGMLT